MKGEIRIGEHDTIGDTLLKAVLEIPAESRISHIDITSTDGYEGFIREIVIHWDTEI